MKHLFGNLVASIDVETTGTLAGHHEIVQIAVVPLDGQFCPLGISPFYMNIRPAHPERADPKAFEINALDLDELASAPDADRAADLFEEWFNQLPLPTGKQLVPMAHNWPFEFTFLRAWLGIKAFERFFHMHPRDAMICALAIKDKCGLLGHPVPFESVSLTNLCKVYGIINDKPHDALADAIAEAALYKKMLEPLR